MNYIFDIIMVAVFAIAIFISYKRGLVLTVLSLTSVAIALVAAQFLSPYVTGTIEKTSLDEKITSIVREKTEDLYGEHVESEVLKSCEEILIDMHIPDTFAHIIAEKISDMDETETFEKNIEKISVAAANTAVRLISYLIIAIIIAVSLLAVISAVKLARLIPAVKKLDNGGGALIGILLGCALVYVICIAVCLCSIVSGNKTLSEIVEKSYIIGVIDRVGAFIAVL